MQLYDEQLQISQIRQQAGLANFQPLPAPTGAYPYRLPLAEVLGEGVGNKKMVFHTVGDTGGINANAQYQVVKDKMAEQFSLDASAEDKPLFLYHLGDIVYDHGEESEYYKQFFQPFSHYPAPIFAIPGNHDGDVNPFNPSPGHSLDAFVKVFCDTEPRTLPISGSTGRKSMVQPNVYFTLQTPLANIIGLYSNIPKHGFIGSRQRDWFMAELLHAQKERDDKCIIICVHNAVYSADINHGPSEPMKELLEGVFEETQVRPDIVLSGHVHNYQRATRNYGDGYQLPYLISGAGGYSTLHRMQSSVNPIPPDEHFFNDAVIENFCDNMHGFLQIAVEKNNTGRVLTARYFTVPRMYEDQHAPAKLFDVVKLNLDTNRIVSRRGVLV